MKDWIYKLHTLIIGIWTVMATACLGLIAIIGAFFSKNGNFPHMIAQLWARQLLWVAGIRVTIQGLENLVPGRSYIYMANHQSNYDIPVLLGRLPAQFRWLAKAELFKIPVFGQSMRGCGYISIDRTDRKRAFASLAQAAETIRAGTSVMIFPEGTRSVDGRLKGFKKGGFVLSVDAGVPIVPIILKGTFEIMPKGRLTIRRRPVTMTICPPIETADYTRKTKDHLIERVRTAMLNQLDDRTAAEGHPSC
ncbi:MAG: lysophospholipid acyltransferase family protein [Desulfosarcinaceae bacterium]|nr:lysophospholipid acyltransferase family protein [Desulfosarcinaceae bacterium]